jgi:hypothetical protein
MTHRLRHILSGLLLLAILTAGIIPAGFMPVVAKAKGAPLFALELCTATGLKTVYVPRDQTPAQNLPDDHQKHDTHQNDCPYAPVLSKDVTPPAPLPQPLLFIAARNVWQMATGLAAPFRAKTWQAQAPPAL